MSLILEFTLHLQLFLVVCLFFLESNLGNYAFVQGRCQVHFCCLCSTFILGRMRIHQNISFSWLMGICIASPVVLWVLLLGVPRYVNLSLPLFQPSLFLCLVKVKAFHGLVPAAGYRLYCGHQFALILFNGCTELNPHGFLSGVFPVHTHISFVELISFDISYPGLSQNVQDLWLSALFLSLLKRGHGSWVRIYFYIRLEWNAITSGQSTRLLY